jgi:glycosyltransferase involved in cell wall biosynthesis
LGTERSGGADSPANRHDYGNVIIVANARIPGERAQSIQTVRTAAAFVRAGCEVDLLYARRRVRRRIEGAGDLGPLEYYGVKEAVRLHAIPVFDLIEAVPRRLQWLPARLEETTFAWNAARWLRRAEGALVHCREIEVGALLARRRHPNYLFEAHSIPDHPVRRRWMRAALLGSLGIVAITDGLAADLAEAFGVARGEILVAPDAFEARAFASLPARDAARAALAIPTDRFVVLYAGHLFPWKGADTLLAAAARIPTIHFLFVGGLPEDVERLRGRARGAGNVEILGHRPPTEIPNYLAAADLVAIPNSGKQPISARHTSPMKLFEAMAAARAIVASDLPSLREVLVHGRNAWLVPPDDPTALAGAIERLVHQPDLATSLADSARHDVAAFTFDARAKKLLDFARARAAARAR